MFTDSTATPTRVELLIDVVRSMSGRKLDAQTVKEILQPSGLPGLSGKFQQSGDILAAARDLQLIVEEKDGQMRPARQRDNRAARDVLLEAIDERILHTDGVEPWFALFYAYILGRDEVARPGEGDRWESDFNRDLFASQTVPNRFNKTKYVGLRRWLRYAGLGWHDSTEAFVPNPYDRVARALQRIFSSKKGLQADEFMSALATACPELDGGWIFLKANPSFDAKLRKCTTGLSHALVDLHADGAIRLDCPIDSDGWSIAAAAPPFDGQWIKSDRFTEVSLPAARKERALG